jgi:hypothetical protein
MLCEILLADGVITNEEMNMGWRIAGLLFSVSTIANGSPSASAWKTASAPEAPRPTSAMTEL